MKLAEKDWKAQAVEIAAGRKKNLFDELEDRGFIKDVVGYVSGFWPTEWICVILTPTGPRRTSARL